MFIGSYVKYDKASCKHLFRHIFYLENSESVIVCTDYFFKGNTSKVFVRYSKNACCGVVKIYDIYNDLVKDCYTSAFQVLESKKTADPTSVNPFLISYSESLFDSVRYLEKHFNELKDKIAFVSFNDDLTSIKKSVDEIYKSIISTFANNHASTYINSQKKFINAIESTDLIKFFTNPFAHPPLPKTVKPLTSFEPSGEKATIIPVKSRGTVVVRFAECINPEGFEQFLALNRIYKFETSNVPDGYIRIFINDKGRLFSVSRFKIVEEYEKV